MVLLNKYFANFCLYFQFKVVLHTELERKLPAILLEKVDKDELIEYPNNKKCKLGFLDLILRKWFCNPFTDDSMFMFTLNLLFKYSLNIHIKNADCLAGLAVSGCDCRSRDLGLDSPVGLKDF